MKKLGSVKRYIFIGIIIMAITIVTNVGTGKKEETKPEKEVVSGKAIVVEDGIVPKKDEPVEAPANPEESPEAEEEADDEFMLQYPVGGQIIKEFSEGKLIYSETLKDYRIHNGVDIKSEILGKVIASESGIVESVKNDVLMGITVTIDHENGIKTIYSNLSSMDMVSEGDRVEKSQVINGVGDTSLIETGQEPHIHFEILVDGVYVNPRDYIV